MNIEIGSFYEIDNVYLPPRTPVQLKSIRVAMVCEKTALNVAIRFPSMQSLQAYLNNNRREIMYPALDEKFVMGTALAGKVLLRQVPSQEFSEKKNLHSFWFVNKYYTRKASSQQLPLVGYYSENGQCLNDQLKVNSKNGQCLNDQLKVNSKNGQCLTDQLKVNGMVTWGIRRQVKFLGRHEEISNNTKSDSSFVHESDVQKVEQNEEEDEEEEEEEDENGGTELVKQEEDEEGNDSDDDDDVKEKGNGNLKRKRYSSRKTARRANKRAKIKKKKNQCRELMVYKDPKIRWSEERYKFAEKSLMEVMKAEKATAKTPILRPDLRAEARKRIRDTGLLDHLLKHLADKIAPGGKERFRRRHNAEGAMEYWLESAELVNIRKEAGVNDPYWVPPPGWKLGDSPIQHPICAQEFKNLKDEIFQVKRDKKQLEEEVGSLKRDKKQLEEEVGSLKRKIEELESQHENQSAIVTSRTPKFPSMCS